MVSSEQLGGTNVVFHLMPLSQAPWIAAPSCSTLSIRNLAQSFGHRTIVYANSGEGSLKHSWPQIRVQRLFEDRKVEPQACKATPRWEGKSPWRIVRQYGNPKFGELWLLQDQECRPCDPASFGCVGYSLFRPSRFC